MYSSELSKNPYGFSEEELAIGRLAYQISKKYERCSFADTDALNRSWRELVDHGFAGMYLPEAYGGLGQSLLTMCIAFEQSSATGWPASRLVLTQGIFSSILLRNGSEEQKRYWLPRIARGELLFCFGLTEAQTGSNAPNMRTIARRKGDNWVIKGEKTYISAVDGSQAILLAARTPEADNGITLFAIDNPNERIAKQLVRLNNTLMYDKQFTLYIDDLEVGPEAVVGIPGKGMRALFDGLNPERLLVAAQTVGLGRWGIAKAVAYASERQVFDDVIGKYQAVQHPLAEAYAQLEGAWSMTVAATRQYDAGKQAGDETNIAKLLATDACFFALDRCLQTHGGSGFTDETMLLERYLYARLQKTAPINREMTLNHIAWSSLGLPKSY